jgi:hypothetical protein
VEDEHRDLPAVPGERRVAVQVGDLFGLDVRPSRTFVWIGRRVEGEEAVLSLGKPPKVLPETTPLQSKHVGPAEITYLGSPAYTLPLSLTLTAKHLWRRRKAKRLEAGREQ